MGCMCRGAASLLPGGGFRLHSLRSPLEAAPSGRGRPPAWAKRAVFTPVTRGWGWGRKRKPEPSPQLLHSSREEAAGAERWAGGNGGPGRAGGRRGGGRAPASPAATWGGEEEAVRCALDAAGFPAPSAEQGRARARSPQARRAGAVPAAPGSAADRCCRRRSGRWAGPPHPLPQSVAGGVPRWRLPGSSGAAAMGMAQGPGEDLAPPGRAGDSEAKLVRAEGGRLTQPCQRSSALDAHPEFQRCRGTPIRLPSALFRRRRRLHLLLLLRGEPPPTPHTLPSCSGGTAASLRHFRAQVAKSGPGAGGCWGEVRGRTL